MHTLPMLHMSVRDWYDDDDYEEDILFEDNKMPSSQKIVIPIQESNPREPDTTIPSNELVMRENTSGMAIIESIKKSIEKMKLVELQAALKKLNMKSSGAKSILQERLLAILLEEAGLS